jgi:hypothetical protein
MERGLFGQQQGRQNKGHITKIPRQIKKEMKKELEMADIEASHSRHYTFH